MGFKTYLFKNLKKAFKLSKFKIIKDKIFSKYHLINKSDKNNTIKENNTSYTKFHRSFYKKHILELANDLSSEEQEVSSEVLAEPEIQIESNYEEESSLNNIEDLISESTQKLDFKLPPNNSRLISIIIKKGRISEKIYLGTDGNKISKNFET